MSERRPPARSFRWRRLDLPGSETAHLRQVQKGWALSGEAVAEHENGRFEVSYSILCDTEWRTQFVRVERRHAGESLARTFVVLNARWTSGDHRELPALEGCLDVDLAFTPATNTLPIRRLNLEIGQSANVAAAWLSFPDLEIDRLEQVYTREDEQTYRYESDGGAFVRRVTVDDIGFVVEYPGLWTREGSD